MAFKDYRLFAGLRHRYASSAIANSRSMPSYLRIFQKRQWVKRSVVTKPKSWLPIGGPRHHFGPKAHIPDLFERKDSVHLKLAAQQLEWYETPPRLHHDLLEAVAKVGRLEGRVNYIFKNKMTCVEALKVTSSVTPLFFKGVVYKVGRNNRLALLGDRVLRLALCEIWLPTGNSLSDYMKMHTKIESRVSLAKKGRALGVHKELLLAEGVDKPETFQIAEAFEAVIGAIYLDSGKSIEVVKKVINDIKLDNHKYLRPDSRSRYEQNMRELRYHKAEGEILHAKTKSLEHKAIALQKERQDADALATEQQGDNSMIDPQIQVTAKKTTELSDHKTTTLQGATEDGKTPIEELEDNLTVDFRMEARVKRRIQHLASLSSRKKKEIFAASRKNRREDKLASDSQTRTDSEKNAVDDLQSDENMLSGDFADNRISTIATQLQDLPVSIIEGQSGVEAGKESTIRTPRASSALRVNLETVDPPECTSATIMYLVKKIKKLTKRWTGGSSWRAQRRWTIEHQELLKEAWDAATKKTLDLRKLRLPADLLVLYEKILQEKLEAILEREQHWRGERKVANAHKGGLASIVPHETDNLGAEEHSSSYIIQKTPSNPKKPGRATKPTPPEDKLERDEFSFPIPDKPTTETSTYIWTPAKSKKTVVRGDNDDSVQKRLPHRDARKTRYRTGP